ncbi:hypothetical protein [Halorussus ruber]|uniref:hypothetical protein n=1 Tax=Halorussus ruber TaxID=1126238 RepID=UPI001091897E|nr:hypothetical protein [Halorussus ruber]
MNRRSFGALVATVGVAGLSGCLSEYLDSGNEQTHEVLVVNETDERQLLTVTVTNAEGERLFRHEYRLDPQKVDESREFSGKPATVRVAVEGGVDETLEYQSDTECQPDANVLGIGISAEQTIELFYECG